MSKGELPTNEKTTPVLMVKNLNFYYNNGKQALKDINFPVEANKVSALIGPSGCGKTTLLRCLNRMHDLYGGNRYEGEILFDKSDILEEKELIVLRSRIGMVFQKPTPFPMTIFDNVAYGMRLKGIKKRSVLRDSVEEALRGAALWVEVSDRLNESGLSLSGGQQQRLCIARALAVKPEILLLDEPTSALDPIATALIEELIHKMREQTTVVIVTHNMQQAARVSDKTGFMYMGEMIEYGSTEKIFSTPGVKMTEEYISGRFG